jgi:hypothetical protein
MQWLVGTGLADALADAQPPTQTATFDTGRTCRITDGSVRVLDPAAGSDDWAAQGAPR